MGDTDLVLETTERVKECCIISRRPLITFKLMMVDQMLVDGAREG